MAVDWKAEIEALCEKRGWTLKALAGDLGISQAYLSEVLHGRRPLSMPLKIKLAGRIGWNKTSDLLVELLPDDAAEAWKEWDERGTKALGEKAEQKADNKQAKKPAAKKK